MIRFLLLTLSIFTFSMATSAQAQEFTDAQKAEIKTMFDEYLENSGDKVLQSVNKYQAGLEAKERADASVKAKEFLKDLDAAGLPMAGNPNGDITMVEFFDYNCGYCRKALEAIQTVLKKDKNLKVIFMDMPILGEASIEASKWSLAAHKQGKYFEYHQAIMEHNGPKNEATLEKLAQNLGLDIKKLKKDKDADEIQLQIVEQISRAQDLGIRGTPGFIVGGEVFPGYIPAAQIEEAIKQARAKK